MVMGYEKGGVIREHKGVSETLEYGPAFLVRVGCSMLLRESGALVLMGLAHIGSGPQGAIITEA